MTRIGIIGYKGNMGRAILNLLKRNGEGNLFLSDKNGEENNIPLIKNSDLIFLCVKPKDMKSVISDIHISLDNGRESSIITDKIFVSCAAFIPMSTFETNFNAPTVRLMGNLLISEGKGSVTLFKNEKADSHIKTIKEICRGPQIIEVSNESLIDTSTIMAGCMPAFISYLSSEYINMAISNGFSKEEALMLYRSSVEGTLHLLEKEDPEIIIKNVATAGGVTAKGLEILRKDGVHLSIRNSLKECSHILGMKGKD